MKTMVPIKKGTFVMEYRGEVITRDESYKRVVTVYQDYTSFYFLNYDGSEVIDASVMGNSARFLNHSCGPNLSIERWKLSSYEEFQIGIFAKEDIEADTELTYDYGWQDFSSIVAPVGAASTLVDKLSATLPVVLVDPARQKCFCGSGYCLGYLGKREGKKGMEKSKESKGKGMNKREAKKTRTFEKVQKMYKKVLSKVGRTLVGSRLPKNAPTSATNEYEDKITKVMGTKRKVPKLRGGL